MSFNNIVPEPIAYKQPHEIFDESPFWLISPSKELVRYMYTESLKINDSQKKMRMITAKNNIETHIGVFLGKLPKWPDISYPNQLALAKIISEFCTAGVQVSIDILGKSLELVRICWEHSFQLSTLNDDINKLQQAGTYLAVLQNTRSRTRFPIKEIPKAEDIILAQKAAML